MMRANRDRIRHFKKLAKEHARLQTKLDDLEEEAGQPWTNYDDRRRLKVCWRKVEEEQDKVWALIGRGLTYNGVGLKLSAWYPDLAAKIKACGPPAPKTKQLALPKPKQLPAPKVKQLAPPKIKQLPAPKIKQLPAPKRVPDQEIDANRERRPGRTPSWIGTYP
jgi:hypothetical protein